MGKHKKHGYGHKSSSSSSSSSSSDDEQYRHLPKHERKRLRKLRKQQRKGKLPHGAMPGMYPGGAPHGVPHGMPGQHGAPGYPGQPAYPPAGGYPGGAGGYPTGVAPPPAGYGPPPPGGYPAGGAPAYPQAPAQAYPGQQPPYAGQPPPGGAYPGSGPYPTSTTTATTSSAGAGGFAPMPSGGAPPMPSGGAPMPSGGVPPSGYGAPSGPSTAGGFAAPGSSPYPAAPPPQPGVAPAPGYPQGGYPQPGGAPPPQPGYPQPGGPGYSQPGVPPPGQPGMAPPPGQPGMVPPAQPGYPQPGPPGGVPPGQMPPGGVGGAAAQFQRMGLQGTADIPRPTIRPAANFSAERDTEIIRKAMKGMGTDEKAIIDIISQRSNQQRQQIMMMFKTMYGKDLIRDLESELSGDFRETIMALFKATTYYDAWSLYQAMSGIGTKESALIEILCTRTNAEIREINECYKQHLSLNMVGKDDESQYMHYYRRTLEKDIMDDTSGHFKRLLVSCCQANRAELTPQQLQRVQYEGAECIIDRNLARDDAQKLFQAGERRMGTDESAFLAVMAIRHYYQLRATFEEYVKIAGRDILSSIGREMSGDLEDGFKALVMSAKNRPEYFADKLHDAMKGAGTKDSTLIRIIVSRSEIDLQDIKEVYLFKYHKTLATAISSDTSGDYKRLLLAIAGQ